jgi:hypothetical protein
MRHFFIQPNRDARLQYAQGELGYRATVGQERAENIHVADGIAETEFVKMRTARDATLAMPALLLPSVQVNVRAGTFPSAESNGVRYLKIPLNAV